MGVVTLVTLVIGLSVERGATLVGLAVVAGVVSLASFADGSIKRWRTRPPRSARG